MWEKLPSFSHGFETETTLLKLKQHRMRVGSKHSETLISIIMCFITLKFLSMFWYN